MNDNEKMPSAATWMDLEILILSEVSQISYDSTYMWNLKTKKILPLRNCILHGETVDIMEIIL